MKVIIIEVTRAANSFGAHPPARDPPRLRPVVSQIVADGQADGAFRTDIDADFVGMAFYGAIEQVLSGWVFELNPTSDEEFERAGGR